MRADTPVPVEPLAVDTAGAARLLAISQSHLHAMRAAGKLGPSPVGLGRSRRYVVAELRDWLAAGAPSRARWAALRGRGQ